MINLNYLEDNIQDCKGSEEKEKLLIIFGATGDLTHRKLLPAIYNLCYDSIKNNCKVKWKILAIGRRNWDKEDYRNSVRQWIKDFSRKEVTEEYLTQFLEYIDYYQMDIEDISKYSELFDYFSKKYQNHENIYYYAVAPRFFEPISSGLKSIKNENVRGKVIIEKPFGENLNQAKKHYECIAKVMGKDNIYAIDHYLGKEMIQNIFTLRFGNILFQNSWSKESIESIEITASEELGVETRGGYYDKSGAMRDMVQNHLFQILSILTIEPPEDGGFKALAKEQEKVLSCLRYPTKENISDILCIGQYEGYDKEDKVSPKSQTETYVSMVVNIDNNRWQGVPIFIRTGKKLGKRATFVVINFKSTFDKSYSDKVVIEIQPKEGERFYFNIKKPGLTYDIQPVHMDFCQSCQLEAHMNTPEAYERLLQAASLGQKQLFSQWEQIEISWKYIDKIMRLKDEVNIGLEKYEVGSKGPEKADKMLEKYKAKWYDFLNDDNI